MPKRPTPTNLFPVLPEDYAPLLAEIKARVQAARIKAGLAANRELLALYRDIGRLILDRQRKEGWGAKSSTGALHRPATGVSGPGWFFAAQPQIHARLHRGVAGGGNCAAARCTIGRPRIGREEPARCAIARNDFCNCASTACTIGSVRTGNCAATCCTIALVSSLRVAR